MLTQVARGGGGLHDEVFTLGRSKHARLFYGVGNIQEKIFLVFGGLRGTDVASTVVGVVSVVLTSSRELKCSVSDPSVKISKTRILPLGWEPLGMTEPRGRVPSRPRGRVGRLLLRG